jgi:hypothetical protein
MIHNDHNIDAGAKLLPTMRLTTVLRQAASGGKAQMKRNLKSLALSVYFKQPELGMKDYEILSRASAFLLGVDPPELDPEGPYAHLEASERKRKKREYLRTHKYSFAGGPGRNIMDMGWLEFAPRECRPQVHVVCSSHVLAPYLWKDYYPQDWLTKVRQEHCTYALEVFDPEKPEEALAKIALNPEPFHHPEGRDIALIHFKEEESSLKILKDLGVEILHFRDPDKLYQKGEAMHFDGFVVSERNVADSTDFGAGDKDTTSAVADEDLRVFYPHKESGTLSFHTKDRFFASTPEPLPEGLCGAPVLDADGDLSGCVEGIVPVTHKDERLAGSAAFLPSYVMHAFVDYVERGLLEAIMPKDLFQMAVTAKQTNSIGGGVFKADGKGTYTEESNWEEAYDIAIESLKTRYSKKEVDAILETIEREREEVLDIMDKEGGDLDEVMQRVRTKTMQIREMVIDQYRKGQMPDSEEAEGTVEKKA